MATYTLVNEVLAYKGYEFVFQGGSTICGRCELRPVCIGNLRVNRRYRVIKVEDKHFPCPLIRGNVKLVEVDLSPVKASINFKRMLLNVPFKYEGIDCDEHDCEYFENCRPIGLKKGDLCVAVKVVSPIKHCRKNINPKICVLRIVSGED